MKKLAVALALCGSLLCSPVQAKTFVGVLWPMFGPLPAIGLVELVAELKMMPDVEVETYVHQAWPSLVEDLKHLPPGTRTLVVGYSLGANSSVFVANDSKYIDTIIALQPSMLSWNPDVTGRVGHYIEIYNPNPWETFGGMGSKKLIGPNIEYIANNDSHPGAQFDPQFRDLVKSEVAKLVAQDRQGPQDQQDQPGHDSGVVTAYADAPKPIDIASAQNQIIDLPRHAAAKDRVASADAKADTLKPDASKPVEVADNAPAPAMPPERDAAAEPATQAQAEAPLPVERIADTPAPRQPDELAAFLDKLTGTVASGDLSASDSLASGNVSAARQLTRADMVDYAKRIYGKSAHAKDASGKHPATPRQAGIQVPDSGVITTASVAFDRP